MTLYEAFSCYSAIPYSMVVDWNARYLKDANIRRPAHIKSSFWCPCSLRTTIEDISTLDLPPFRLMDLPFEIRKEIFFLAIASSDNFWLDREVISFGESLQCTKFIRGRIVWRGSNGTLLPLLISNKQIHQEVEELLYSRFAFDARWGYTMRYSDPSKTPNRLPKHRIKHITYTPDLTRYMREHRESARLIISGLPMLCSVRIMVSWQCTQRLLVCGHTKVGSLHIVSVARLFRETGKVAIIGQSLTGSLERRLVEDAREELKDEPWYWELELDYPLFVPYFPSDVESHL